MGKSEVSTSVVKWSVGLCNRVSVIIRRCLDQVKFAAYITLTFIKFLYIPLVLFSVIVYMAVCFICFCLILQIMYTYCYVMYSYCYVCSVLGILFLFVVLCIVCM